MTMEIMNLQHLLSTTPFWQRAVCTTLAMFSATTLLAELKPNEQLLEARNMDEKLAKGLTQQATYKLSKMNGLTSPDAVTLLDHLQASKLPTAMKDAIIQELDTLMVNAKGNIAAKVTSTASACDHLNKYLTQDDWSQLESTNSWEGAIVLAKRLKAIRVKSIKETTKRAAVAILLCIQQQEVATILGSAKTKLGHWDSEPLGLALAGILGHCVAKAKLGYWMTGSHCLAPAGLAGHSTGANSMEMHLAARHVLVHCHVWLAAQGWSYWLLGGACWLGHDQSHLVKVPGLRILVGLWVSWVNLEAWNTIWSTWLVGHSLGQVFHQTVNGMEWQGYQDTGPVEPASFPCHVRKAASPEDEKTCSCQGCQDCQD